MSNNSLIRKLRHLCSLDGSDLAKLDFRRGESFAAGEEIIPFGAEVTETSLLLEGAACRYKMVGDGRRAIISILVPGDFTNLLFCTKQRLDFAVAALTPCEVVRVPCARLQNLALDNSRLANALWSCAQIDGAIQRGWLATLGQYPANKRIAHFLCELRQRLEWVGLADARGYKLPLTQEDIADAMGLSAVHVNRVIQSLRAENLINTAGHILVIPDLKRLEAFADFDPSDLLSYRVTDEPLAHTFSRSPRDNGCEEAPLISASLSGPADH